MPIKPTFFARTITLIVAGSCGTPALSQSSDNGCNDAGTYLLERAIARGDKEAKYALSKRLIEAPCTSKSHERGFTLLQELAVSGHSSALFDLGSILISSAETDLEESQGIAFVYQSASQGFAEAQVLYGLLLISDAQQEDDRQRALFWLGSAADNGIAHAAKAVSVMYAQGMHGIPADACLAALWDEAAVLIENPNAATDQQTSSVCRE